jgi:hypothetical protein
MAICSSTLCRRGFRFTIRSLSFGRFFAAGR